MTGEIVPTDCPVEPVYEVEVVKALVAMSRILANAPTRDAELVNLWTMILQEAGVQAQHIVPAAIKLLADPNREGRFFFPTPAVLAAYALDLAFVPVAVHDPTPEELRLRGEEFRRRMAEDRAHFDAIRAARLERQGATIQ